MAVPSDDIEMAGATKRKKRDSYDSTYTGDESNSKGSNSKMPSIAVPIDASVLEMISAVRDDEDSDDDSHKRKSQLFCFCCCDLINACIVMNIIHILLSFVHIIVSEVATLDWGAVNIDLYVVEDDDGIETLNPWGVLSYAKMGFGYVFALVSIVGAIKFNKCMVLSGSIWYLIYILLSAIGREWELFFISMPFAYTNIHCYMALRSGSITRENYATEKAICGGCERFD